MRDLAQMLAHTHDAAMEVGEGRRRQRSAGEDNWNRRGRWREALKDGLVASLRAKALALND
jgi:hypothetical protein